VPRTEIRITGFGGQGVVMCGYVVGRAYAIEAGHQATMIQSFGPEARGSSCSATLVLSEDEILYPYARRPHVLVAMSAEGYDKYRHELRSDGILVYEQDLVDPAGETRTKFGVPSTRIAENLGRTIVQNIVMLGFFAAVTGFVTRGQMRAAVEASVPAGTVELNRKAFDAGWDHYQQEQRDREPWTRPWLSDGREPARSAAGRTLGGG
jgi:2-oxoglutarate ferredoxin oxidoreductase subunit gamma